MVYLAEDYRLWTYVNVLGGGEVRFNIKTQLGVPCSTSDRFIVDLQCRNILPEIKNHQLVNVIGSSKTTNLSFFLFF